MSTLHLDSLGEASGLVKSGGLSKSGKKDAKRKSKVLIQGLEGGHGTAQTGHKPSVWCEGVLQKDRKISPPSLTPWQNREHRQTQEPGGSGDPKTQTQVREPLTRELWISTGIPQRRGASAGVSGETLAPDACYSPCTLVW